MKVSQETHTRFEVQYAKAKGAGKAQVREDFVLYLLGLDLQAGNRRAEGM